MKKFTEERLRNLGNGYDHNWVINGRAGDLRKAAEAYDPISGRSLEVLTTQPGMQFYAGNFLDGSLIGKNGIRYNRRYGFCFETQHFPDGINHSEFPSMILRPGEEFHEKTVFKFGLR